MNTGREFLQYARETLAEEKYEAAVYLSCVAEYEFAKVGDSEGLLESIQFTNIAKINLINEMESLANKRRLSLTQEFMNRFMERYCSEVLKHGLKEVMEEFPFYERQIPDELVTTIENRLKEIPEKWE